MKRCRIYLLISCMLFSGCVPAYRVLTGGSSNEEVELSVPEYTGTVNPYTGLAEDEDREFYPQALMTEKPVEAEILVEILTEGAPVYMALWSHAEEATVEKAPGHAMAQVLAQGWGAEYVSVEGSVEAVKLEGAIWDFYPPGYTEAVGEEANCVTVYPGTEMRETEFRYDLETGRYYAGEMSWDNLILLEAEAWYEADGEWVMDLRGGTGYYFRQGKYEEIRWQEIREDQPLELWTEDMEPLRVYAGRTYLIWLPYGEYSIE